MGLEITNCCNAHVERPRLPVERTYLYRPEREWTYSHHASITHHGGRLYAIWSNGRVDEDAPGQRVLLSTAEDFRAWSDPRPLVDTLMGAHSELVLTAAGFHQHAGQLVAYFGQYEYTRDSFANGERVESRHMDTGLRAVTSIDGQRWSSPRDVVDREGARLPIVPNHGPQEIASGRLIISGNVAFPYTDDPSGLTGWTMTGIYPDVMASDIYDDPDGFWRVRERMDWPVGLCEGSFYQTDDGVIHMLLRSTGEGFTGKLWLTESDDDGATWSAPREVDFPDNNAKFHFGRLPDGRYYYVGNPDSEPREARCPLVLSLSRDGRRFDRHFILADEDYVQKVPGRHKEGLYGYPHTLVHEDHLYVIVSLRKEAVAVLRTPLSAF